jgi:16S rRNA processing protein RimM
LADRVLLGAVIGAHGITGEVRVKTFTADPDALGAYGPLTTNDGRRLAVVALRTSKPGEVVVRFDNVADRDAAEALKGRELFVPRDALPKPEADEFYHADLIGLAVEDLSNTALGRVRAMHNFGAGDMMEIETPSGETEFVPFNASVVKKVELPTRIVIEPPSYESSGDEEEA